MITVLIMCYLALEISLVSWGGWTYQKGVKNIFADFSLPSVLTIVALLSGSVMLFWPLIFINWAQVQRQESYLKPAKVPEPFQGHYQAVHSWAMSPP
jgi:hypothetical protein